MAKKMHAVEIDRLETQLESALTRVAPRPEYKSYLHDRLVTPPSELRVELVNSSPRNIILAAVGLAGSLILVVATIRALLTYTRGNNHQFFPRSSG
ncbi:MAG: hypothetical protein ACK2UW_12285 [Anaerolineales bacterium]|jgi:hypothetical protein